MRDYAIEVFFDGHCPLCRREMAMIKNRDRKDRIRCVDIAASDFDASTVGISWETLMERIHGRLPDGRLISGVEVFRVIYDALGFSRLVRLSRLPGITQLLDVGYRLFAKNRLRLTGRCDIAHCRHGEGAHV